jgi:hypothetical protein
MTTTATLTYTAFLGGASAATVAALMAAVPVPPSLLEFYGVRVISDSTPITSPVVRTIVLGLGPPSTATATATLATNDSGSPVGAVTVTSPGAGYVVPPIVSFMGGRPTPPNAPGYPTQTIDVNQLAGSLNSPAVAQAYLNVESAAVATAGSGYSAATTIKLTGGLSQNGVQAVLTPTIVGGHITAVTVTSAGSGYTGVPQVTIDDPAVSPGSGGVVTVSMGLGSIQITRGGTGYSTPPTVVLTPLFQALFPATGDQATPFMFLMNTALEQAVQSPVSASVPVIA